MIDWQSETLIPFAEAAKHVPGRRGHVATLYRWAQRRTNPLETIKIGTRVYTSEEAIGRFIAGCNGTAPPPASEGQERRIATAEAECKAAGIV